MSNLSSFVVELRFKPSASILDKRGQIAEALADESLPVWSIGPDRIDITNPKNKKIQGSFLHQACGFTGKLIEPEEFKDAARKFMQKAWGFCPRGTIYRIGIRSRFVRDLSDQVFTELVEKYKNKFIKLENSQLEQIGELTDIAFPALEMKVGDDRMTFKAGPMKKEQTKQELEISDSEVSKIPDVGNFIDVDYFTTDQSTLSRKQATLDFIGKGINKAMQIDEKFNEWLFPSSDAE